LSLQQEFDVIAKCFNEVDIGGKVTIKGKLREIAYPYITSLFMPLEKVKTKGSQKSKQNRFEKSTKCNPSYFEHVDKIQSIEDSCSSHKASRVKVKTHLPIPSKVISMLDHFHPICHSYIVDIFNVKVDGHCGYRSIVALLGMGEESWLLIRMDLFKEISQWRDQYISIFGSIERLDELKNSLLVKGTTSVSVSYIP